MNSLVSIIIPTYNRSQLISETLDSVLAQSYPNWECIIVDDHSTDHTVEIIEKHIKKDSRFSVEHRPSRKSKGANACRNHGFEESKGDYILFLDSDDILKDTCIENRLKAINSAEKIDFVIANSSYLKDGVFYEKSICEFPSDYKSEDYLKLFLSYKLPWTVMSVLWKKNTIQDFQFDEDLTRLQDIDYHITILSKRNYNIFRLNDIDNYYRIDDNKGANTDHVSTVIKALTHFLNKYINQDFIKKKYSNEFKQFILFFLQNYLYPNNKNHKSEIRNIDEIIWKSNMFSIKELTLIKSQKLLITSGLINKKGLGINRIHKFLKKGLPNA